MPNALASRWREIVVFKYRIYMYIYKRCLKCAYAI